MLTDGARLRRWLVPGSYCSGSWAATLANPQPAWQNRPETLHVSSRVLKTLSVPGTPRALLAGRVGPDLVTLLPLPAGPHAPATHPQTACPARVLRCARCTGVSSHVVLLRRFPERTVPRAAAALSGSGRTRRQTPGEAAARHTRSRPESRAQPAASLSWVLASSVELIQNLFGGPARIPSPRASTALRGRHALVLLGDCDPANAPPLAESTGRAHTSHACAHVRTRHARSPSRLCRRAAWCPSDVREQPASSAWNARYGRAGAMSCAHDARAGGARFLPRSRRRYFVLDVVLPALARPSSDAYSPARAPSRPLAPGTPGRRPALPLPPSMSTATTADRGPPG
ncbi:hypothetical protein CERSUDRAFT_95448 [Gelatoporia subvermispora B]|uniref:Uncharacterized protein n=1 Tax=Ceriporiopsis subvermispora (strain B) TaxID=914234 RepID=M2QYF1_CERS8|nr:hypothetical protein CERSUDRAFT_95448 [Gelatoporia subvermispora B]